MLIDLHLPLDEASAVLFLTPVLCSGLAGKPWLVWATAFCVCMLTIIGYTLSPGSIADVPHILANRAIAIFAIGSAAWYLIQRIARENELRLTFEREHFVGQVRQAMEMAKR